MSKMVNLVKIIAGTENGKIANEIANFKAYVGQIDTYNGLNKIEKKTVVLDIADLTGISVKGIQKSFSILNRGLKNKLKLSKYISFNEVVTLCIEIENKTKKVGKLGGVKTDLQEVKKQEILKDSMQRVSDANVIEISINPEFKALMKVAKELGWNMNDLKKAIK